MNTPPCRHPAPRLYAWFTTESRTSRRDWLCVGCTACGAVLAGSAEDYETARHHHNTPEGTQHAHVPADPHQS